MAKRKKSSSDSSDDDVKDIKPSRVASSDSSSSSDEDDGDWNAKKSSKAKTKKSRVVKKKQIEDDIEKEDGEVDDDEDEEDIEEFNDGYDENLMGDDDDQKRLAMMTEKEREQELFNRSEKREVLKTRFEIEKKLRMAKKKEMNKSQTDVSVRSTERRRNMEDKKKVKDAIKDLKSIREKKKEKLQKQQRLRAADVYSSDSDSDEDKNAERKSSSSSSSSSSDSSSDSEDDKKKRNDDNKKDSDDWDDRNSDREDEAESWQLTCEHLNEIRLSRHKMELWCHSPFFNTTIIGCFVRIGIGLDPTNKKNRYVVAQISDVVETAKVYNLGQTRTNRGIKLKHARQTEKVYRLEYVSDSAYEQKEFDQWLENMNRDRCDIISKEFYERKKRDITNAFNYRLNDAEIDAIVDEKRKFNIKPVNYAMRKNQLMREKELADLNGDHEKVERLLQEIDDIESEAKTLDKKRTQNIAAISYINERNRMRNILEAEKALTEQSAAQKASQKDDPFTRRKCTPTMIHMFNKNKLSNSSNKLDSNLLAVDESKEEPKDDTKSEDEVNGSKDFVTIDTNVDTNLLQKTSALIADKPPLSPGHHNDLFAAHNFDIKIDFDVDIGIPAPSSGNSLTNNNNSLSTIGCPLNTPKIPNRRSLNLDEYKKKKGLI
ncbi:RNA polymerase-associated protein RTF1 homolog [Oppia nitens]|uniref:RNA polymerase-associated protein RTF1 homolog n=1 Tax=Oppia nitens TaxID=1686743 RepID=UPI0023DB0BF9|nr:RNA polymerase-associated protein RTF1 homolog [Oppia nitens]